MKKILPLFRFGNPQQYKKNGGNCWLHMNKCENVKYKIPEEAKTEEFYILVFQKDTSEIKHLPSCEIYKERVNNKEAKCCLSVYLFVNNSWEKLKNEKEKEKENTKLINENDMDEGESKKDENVEIKEKEILNNAPLPPQVPLPQQTLPSLSMHSIPSLINTNSVKEISNTNSIVHECNLPTALLTSSYSSINKNDNPVTEDLNNNIEVTNSNIVEEKMVPPRKKISKREIASLGVKKDDFSFMTKDETTYHLKKLGIPTKGKANELKRKLFDIYENTPKEDEEENQNQKETNIKTMDYPEIKNLIKEKYPEVNLRCSKDKLIEILETGKVPENTKKKKFQVLQKN